MTAILAFHKTNQAVMKERRGGPCLQGREVVQPEEVAALSRAVIQLAQLTLSRMVVLVQIKGTLKVSKI